MQAVFHPSQPNVQYPRYSSEHETKAAAAEATDIQPANSHTHTCHSTSLIWRFNLTVLLQFAPTITDIPLNHFWKISCEKLKFWSTCKQLVLWSSEWRFEDDQHRLDHSFLWLRCVSGVLNWLYRNTKPSPALCRRTNRKPGEKTDVLTDHSWSKVDIGHDSTKGPRVILSCVKTLLPNCSWQVQSRIFQVFQTKKWNAEVVFAGLHCAQTANVR